MAMHKLSIAFMVPQNQGSNAAAFWNRRIPHSWSDEEVKVEAGKSNGNVRIQTNSSTSEGAWVQLATIRASLSIVFTEPSILEQDFGNFPLIVEMPSFNLKRNTLVILPVKFISKPIAQKPFCQLIVPKELIWGKIQLSDVEQDRSCQTRILLKPPYKSDKGTKSKFSTTIVEKDVVPSPNNLSIVLNANVSEFLNNLDEWGNCLVVLLPNNPCPSSHNIRKTNCAGWPFASISPLAFKSIITASTLSLDDLVGCHVFLLLNHPHSGEKDMILGLLKSKKSEQQTIQSNFTTITQVGVKHTLTSH
ncbi:hypothetical protein BT69DRAFT_1304556 [Atractiella rhizophila]|nr:hypothetical protein BT69DRAFT_1304556 [Atractiella rhizophila]